MSLLALAMLFGLATIAHAQVQPPAGVQLVHNALPSVAGATTPASDIDSGSGAGMAALFWIFAALSVGGSIFVITRRNLIAAVMGMVGTFFGLAVLYMMLYAAFLAVIQMLVYAGAIMVLFVFVIMVLNKPEDEPWGLVGLPGKILAGLAMLYLTARLVFVVWSVTPPDAKLAEAAPPPVASITWVEDAETHQLRPITQGLDWGSTAAVGTSLFGDYVFPFEAISILLLIAVVGAIAIARPLKDDEQPDAKAGGTP